MLPLVCLSSLSQPETSQRTRSILGLIRKPPRVWTAAMSYARIYKPASVRRTPALQLRLWSCGFGEGMTQGPQVPWFQTLPAPLPLLCVCVCVHFWFPVSPVPGVSSDSSQCCESHDPGGLPGPEMLISLPFHSLLSGVLPEERRGQAAQLTDQARHVYRAFPRLCLERTQAEAQAQKLHRTLPCPPPPPWP